MRKKGSEDKVLGSASLREVKLAQPGAYKVEVSAGVEAKTVTRDVYPTANEATSRTPSFWSLMAFRSRIAPARIISKGIAGHKACAG
ncbi:hypothetical protein [Ochrobactrum soli]|uniref:Uncharacterized protein n=1 Tax=Ochrobactrum soli TaxID=2448455 RepID=A0A849KRT2_9HYPH|nr:hypothetical protein [[Ochrobactrum] soli]